MSLPKEIFLAAIREREIYKGITYTEQEKENLRLSGDNPLFQWALSDSKYGSTTLERGMFWQEVLVKNNYDLFFEKFPRNEEINLNGVKYVL